MSTFTTKDEAINEIFDYIDKTFSELKVKINGQFYFIVTIIVYQVFLYCSFMTFVHFVFLIRKKICRHYVHQH